MGVYSGQLSYIRYKTFGDFPSNLKEFVLEKLKKFSFQEIEPASLAEKAIGWVTAENMALCFFDDFGFAKSQYFVFSLRIDERRIPALTKKAEILKKEGELKKNTGRERLSKQDRDMLKEQVLQSLIKKALPSASVFDICWNSKTMELLFFNTGKKTNEEFAGFFKRCFDCRITQISAFDMGGIDENRYNTEYQPEGILFK